MASLYGYTTPVMGSHFVMDNPDSVNLKFRYTVGVISDAKLSVKYLKHIKIHLI